MSGARAALVLAAALSLVGCVSRPSCEVPCDAVPVVVTVADTLPEPIVRAWPVMGTMLEVRVWDADSARTQRALAAARAAVFRVDTLMSVYKPASELSVINRRAGTDTATSVSEWTAEVLAAALEVAAESDGALDVTVGPLVEAWGFYRHRGEVPPRAVRDSIAPLVGWRKVEFDRARRTVRLPLRGMRLDFGGIAKGYAVDRGVEALRAAGVTMGMVDLGGNFRVFGPPPEGNAWTVGLKDPRDPEEVFALAAIDSGAVGTSGDYEQFFVRDGVRYSHVFDPRTREPARGVIAVSVIAPTGLLSDALSKPFYILGPVEGCRLARRYPGVEVVWVVDAGQPEERATDPAYVVMTDGLAERLELAVEEGVEPAGRARTCGEVLR